nr:reverse transcriptase domain-containing protein [Tanacetum cinerariifolium]
MLRTYYGYGLMKRTIIQIFYHGLDDPTQEILDAKGIFLYNTPNKAFKILEDKVLFKLDFSDDSQNNPKPKAIVYTSGSDINLDYVILMEKFATLATKIDSEFLIIRKELNEMRDGHRDYYASQIYMNDETPMCEPHEVNYVQGYHRGYHAKIPKSFTPIKLQPKPSLSLIPTTK